MSLANLLKTNQLQVHSPSKEAVQRLLEAAKRNLADAHIVAVSGENRFDAAYKCMMQCAMAALWVNGYRTSTSQPGHHQTTIQTLPTTIGLPNSTVIILDNLRKLLDFYQTGTRILFIKKVERDLIELTHKRKKIDELFISQLIKSAHQVFSA